jgi:Leucine-rich repeat (LRR) protein
MLTHLSLARCKHLKSDLRFLNRFPNLGTLVLDHVRVTILPTKLLALKRLSLVNTGTTDEALVAAISNMPLLEHLNVEACAVSKKVRSVML